MHRPNPFSIVQLQPLRARITTCKIGGVIGASSCSTSFSLAAHSSSSEVAKSIELLLSQADCKVIGFLQGELVLRSGSAILFLTHRRITPTQVFDFFLGGSNGNRSILGVFLAFEIFEDDRSPKDITEETLLLSLTYNSHKSRVSNRDDMRPQAF